MNNLGHIEAMKVMFFLKCSKFYVVLENAIKRREIVSGFEDNCVSTCSWSFCQLWEQYMWWAVSVLKSGPRISYPNRGHDTKPNLFDISGTLA